MPVISRIVSVRNSRDRRGLRLGEFLIMTTRRAFLALTLGFAVAPQAAFSQAAPASAQRETLRIGEQPGYVPTRAEEQLDGALRRQVVFFRSTEPPGTVIIHTSERFLYVVQDGQRAVRYGIGVGREGFQWSGLERITRKQEWPDWRPPPEMLERQPYLPRFMAGGEGNPMGARALYLGNTVYRLHGTNQPQTIGHAVSSGCFRLVNGDIIDLYDRIPVGTRVIIRHQAAL
jgi:lipoprotein-anchoring transpeptidase ErfK/SrfK